MNTVKLTSPSAPVEASGTNTSFHHEVETRAPPPAIWRLWTDVTTWPSWDTELESVRLDAPFAVGVTGTLKGKGSPEAAFVIDEVVPGTRYRFSTKLPFGGALVIERTLTPTAAGTRFQHDVRFQGFGGWLMSGFLGASYRKALPVVMEKLRALAEGAS